MRLEQKVAAQSNQTKAGTGFYQEGEIYFLLRKYYIFHDLCLLRHLIKILVTVVLFSLGCDDEKLVYGISYPARFMEAAILTIENEAQTVT